MNLKEIFLGLYNAGSEDEVDLILEKHPHFFEDKNWQPFGGDEKLFGIVRGQQSNPIAAIVEKLTNSIDAILMKKCLEFGLNPKSDKAPKSMEEALRRFFPEFKNWDLQTFRRKQAEEIQIIADGPTRNPSVIIYDNGEGQHPKDFENTFLSLVRGNKINIHFVQGKYNMGGSGALVFCGKKRYQLIASKRFDNSGDFGFTLCRQRKIGSSNEGRRFSYFEYLKIDGEIPSFKIDSLDLKLFNRNFTTGTIIKLFSYQFPSGYSGFAQDLNQSLNEFLFEPILPVYTIDKKERYPNNKVLELDLFGLKRRLEEDKNDYVDSFFSEEYSDEKFGKAKVTCYVFKPKLEKRNVKESKKIISDRFFRNNMSVLFSINGQVQGSYTSEFITRTLKFNLLKDYVLIHCDCTEMTPDFREELFMSDRERLKGGDESIYLRNYLGQKLKNSQLDEINKKRKETVGFESEDTTDLIKSFAKNLPKNNELFKLLQHTLKLEEKKETKKFEGKKPRQDKEELPFNPNRFPNVFRMNGKKGETNVVNLPLNGEKTIKFDTDVEDNYFDRIDDAGDLQLGLIGIKHNDVTGGTSKGTNEEITNYLNVVKSSPNKGLIRLTLNPTKELKVDDEVEIKVSLTLPGGSIDETFLVKIVNGESPQQNAPKPEQEMDNIGLPELIKIKKEHWEEIEQQGISMNYDTVMFPVGEGDKLVKVYVNLDSTVFLNYRAKLKSEEQIELAIKRYLSSIYFHTLFLYMITKRKGYSLTIDSNREVTVDDYIRDVFDSYYSDFLLNFGMEQLINSVD